MGEESSTNSTVVPDVDTKSRLMSGEGLGSQVYLFLDATRECRVDITLGAVEGEHGVVSYTA